jgi:tRNA pseudouridine55 synthase
MMGTPPSGDGLAGVPVPTPCGLLLIDKHQGPTSMGICAAVRARLRRGGAPKRIKVGHAGTLDPMATGLLVVLVGKATRESARFMASEKEYEATIDLAHRSDTDDAEGEVIAVGVATPPTREALEAGLARQVGVIMQTPPAYSAISVGGRRAYDLAREGKAVELAARAVSVHAIHVLDYAWPTARVRVRCGKGTYIRSIARDLGLALGTGGMLTALRRTRSGDLRVEAARSLDQLPDVLSQKQLLAMA